jgi:hypothetical protein
MGCKQYARMLGLSRGYPHILYLDLNKWDAAPALKLSTGNRREHARDARDCVYACISAPVGVHRFRSEIEKRGLVCRGQFSTAESIATSIAT